MVKFNCLIFVLVAFVASTYGVTVLGILPFGATSHFSIGYSIVKSLHKVGHEVTVISPYPQKKPLENYRDISTKDILDKHEKGKEKLEEC